MTHHMYTSDLETTQLKMKTKTRAKSTSGDMKTRPAATELTVERIPALVREVENVMQVIMSQQITTESSEASDKLMQRADEVEAFCRSLRPGPLQEIVAKQVAQLREAAQHLRSPSSRLSADLVGIGVEKPRTRSVPIRVAPFMGSTLARAAAKVGNNAKKHQGANSVRRPVAKPLYRWEKRRLMRGSTVAQPNVASSKANAGRKPKLAQENYLDEVDEARMELHPCSEPGHYSRSSSKSSAATSTPSSFEFQIILTEEEFKALKFQRRRLEAEQRHLSRQNQPTSTIPPPPPTAVVLERKKGSQ